MLLHHDSLALDGRAPALPAPLARAFQRLLFTQAPARAPLYHHNLSRLGGEHRRMAGPRAMRFAKGEVVGFDTYFNAFFESAVVAHTNVLAVELRLEVEGKFYVEMIRFAPGQAPRLVAATEARRGRGDPPLTLRAELTGECPLGSRLAFHLTALSPEARLLGGGWWTVQPARRAVRLAVVICTFKKRAYVERTVRALAGDLAATGATVFVVDNAAEIPRDAFAGLGADVRVVHQGNSGGAGGFTRGMIEAMRAPDERPFTHFLLMDDDIELDGDMMARAIAWQRHLREDQCVGAAMLDLYHPTRLTELGAFMGRPKLLSVSACVGDIDLAPPGALDPLGVLPKPHYNAWWFLTIPRSAVEAHGLPLPCFIRGDDKEFGYRLRQGGVSTLAAPGLGVWHLPFYAKDSAWLFYFNAFNDLLIRALRKPDPGGERMGAEVWGEINHFLFKLEYDHAAVRLRGLEDFLRGPEWMMAQDPEDRFRGALKCARDLAPEHRPDVEPGALATHYRPRRSVEYWWRRHIHNGHAALARREPRLTTEGLPKKVMRVQDWGWTDVTYFDEIGIKRALQPGIQVYRKRPEVYFDLLRRSRAALARLRREWPRLVEAFRAAEPEFTSEAHWRRHLKMDGLPKAEAPEAVAA